MSIRTHLAVVASLALLVAVVASVLAQEPVVWDPVANLSGRPGVSQQAAAAFDPISRSLWVVWREAEAGSLGEIVGRRWNATTCTWIPALDTPPHDLSASQWFDGGPAIAFDDAGTGLLFWTRRSCTVDGAPADISEVMWRAWNGDEWSAAQSLFQVHTCLPTTSGYGLIPVVTSGSIQLYVVWGNGYRVAEYVGGSWSNVIGPNYLAFPDGVWPELADMVMGPDGTVHAAAYAKNSSETGYDVWFYDAYYLRYEGDTWSTPINLSWTDGVANDVALDFDAAGRLHFFWSDDDSVYSSESQKSTIWERVLDDGAWSPNQEAVVDNPGQAVDGFSMARDVTGTLHLAWSEGIFEGPAHADLDLRYQQGDGETWGREEVVYTSTLQTRYPLLTWQAGAPAILWEEGPLDDRDLHFVSQCRDVPTIYKTYLPLIQALLQ